MSGVCGWKHPTTGQYVLWVSNCDDTCAHTFVNLVVTFACCSSPAGVNLLCVVGTVLCPSSVCAATGIHVSVTVHYLLYSGRREFT